MKKISLFILINMTISFAVFAQKQSCKVTWLLIKDNDQRIELNSNQGLMEYNYSTGDFKFNFNVSSFPVNLIAIDSGFSKLSSNEIFFEGNTNISPFNFSNAEEFRDKDLPLEGTLSVNDVRKATNTRFTPLDQVKLYKDPRLTWYFQIAPKDFDLPFFQKFKKIEIIVKDGYLNRL